MLNCKVEETFCSFLDFWTLVLLNDFRIFLKKFSPSVNYYHPFPKHLQHFPTFSYELTNTKQSKQLFAAIICVKEDRELFFQANLCQAG